MLRRVSFYSPRLNPLRFAEFDPPRPAEGGNCDAKRPKKTRTRKKKHKMKPTPSEQRDSSFAGPFVWRVQCPSRGKRVSNWVCGKAGRKLQRMGLKFIKKQRDVANVPHSMKSEKFQLNYVIFCDSFSLGNVACLLFS